MIPADNTIDVAFEFVERDPVTAKRKPHQFSSYLDDFFEWIKSFSVAFVTVIVVLLFPWRMGRQPVWTGRNFCRR